MELRNAQPRENSAAVSLVFEGSWKGIFVQII
jgi:hypothetical protein